MSKTKLAKTKILRRWRRVQTECSTRRHAGLLPVSTAFFRNGSSPCLKVCMDCAGVTVAACSMTTERVVSRRISGMWTLQLQ